MMKQTKYIKYTPHSALFLFALLSLAGCKNSEIVELNGYIEAEPTLVSSSQAGNLTHLTLSKGEWAKAGELLFTLEQENELAQVAEAKSTYQRLLSLIEDNLKGKRPEEKAALQAELDSAKASLKLSEIEVKRQADLIKSGYTSKSNLDTLIAQRDKNLAQVAEAESQIKLAALGIREDLLQASREEASMAQAQLAQAQWRLDQKNIKFDGTTKARVEDIFFRIGEWVPAGTPVMKLQTPELIKARFFVPEAQLSKIQLGQKIIIQCDGCSKPLSAKVSFISTQAEFTPPVIFSQENRERLVFMVEATPIPSDALKFKAGQPVQIHWETVEQKA